MNYIFAMMHNDRLCKDIEKQLNALIRDINKAGGMIWLQSKTNKEEYYELKEEVSVCTMMFTTQNEEEK